MFTKFLRGKVSAFLAIGRVTHSVRAAAGGERPPPREIGMGIGIGTASTSRTKYAVYTIYTTVV